MEMIMPTPYQPRHRWFIRSVIALALLITCIRVWVGPLTMVQPAQAQLPDSALQRKHLLEEARRTNQLLGQIKQLLEKHTFNVRIQGADNQADAPVRPRRH